MEYIFNQPSYYGSQNIIVNIVVTVFLHHNYVLLLSNLLELEFQLNINNSSLFDKNRFIIHISRNKSYLRWSQKKQKVYKYCFIFVKKHNTYQNSKHTIGKTMKADETVKHSNNNSTPTTTTWITKVNINILVHSDIYVGVPLTRDLSRPDF